MLHYRTIGKNRQLYIYLSRSEKSLGLKRSRFDELNFINSPLDRCSEQMHRFAKSLMKIIIINAINREQWNRRASVTTRASYI